MQKSARKKCILKTSWLVTSNSGAALNALQRAVAAPTA
jgi:hypothetical protein